MSAYQTDRVTAKDIEHGQIRLPIANRAKSAFPSVKGDVRVRLRGREMVVSYDPRLGPDRERSGVMPIGKAVMATGIVDADERLTVTPGDPIRID